MFKAPSHNRLSWVLAALMVVALPGARSAFAASSPAAQQINAQLPAGVSLRNATVNQTASALHDAVASNPKAAASLTATAIRAKENKPGGLTRKEFKKLVDAALSAAPNESSRIIDAAVSAMPAYADEVRGSLGSRRSGGGGLLGSVGEAPTEEATGFGAGLGAGFPGSPGFIGSAPSGAFAFPPVVATPLTPVQ